MKKEIVLVIIIGIILLVGSIFLGMKLFAPKEGNVSNDNSTNSNDIQNSTDELVIGKYKLNLGKYEGTYEEYDPDTQKTKSQSIELILEKDSFSIEGQKNKFEIDSEKYLNSNGLIIEVIGDNKLLYQVGSGVELKFVHE